MEEEATVEEGLFEWKPVEGDGGGGVPDAEELACRRVSDFSGTAVVAVAGPAVAGPP